MGLPSGPGPAPGTTPPSGPARGPDRVMLQVNGRMLVGTVCSVQSTLQSINSPVREMGREMGPFITSVVTSEVLHLSLELSDWTWLEPDESLESKNVAPMNVDAFQGRLRAVPKAQRSAALARVFAEQAQQILAEEPKPMSEQPTVQAGLSLARFAELEDDKK